MCAAQMEGPSLPSCYREVQMNNGNITGMTLDQMLQNTQCLDVRAP